MDPVPTPPEPSEPNLETSLNIKVEADDSNEAPQKDNTEVDVKMETESPSKPGNKKSLGLLAEVASNRLKEEQEHTTTSESDSKPIEDCPSKSPAKPAKKVSSIQSWYRMNKLFRPSSNHFVTDHLH